MLFMKGSKQVKNSKMVLLVISFGENVGGTGTLSSLFLASARTAVAPSRSQPGRAGRGGAYRGRAGRTRGQRLGGEHGFLLPGVVSYPGPHCPRPSECPLTPAARTLVAARPVVVRFAALDHPSTCLWWRSGPCCLRVLGTCLTDE